LFTDKIKPVVVQLIFTTLSQISMLCVLFLLDAQTLEYKTNMLGHEYKTNMFQFLPKGSRITYFSNYKTYLKYFNFLKNWRHTFYSNASDVFCL